MNRIKKLILPILSILLIIVTTTFLVKKKREENINNYKNYQLAEEYNALLKDLREEKNKIGLVMMVSYQEIVITLNTYMV